MQYIEREERKKDKSGVYNVYSYHSVEDDYILKHNESFITDDEPVYEWDY